MSKHRDTWGADSSFWLGPKVTAAHRVSAWEEITINTGICLCYWTRERPDANLTCSPCSHLSHSPLTLSVSSLQMLLPKHSCIHCPVRATSLNNEPPKKKCWISWKVSGHTTETPQSCENERLTASATPNVGAAAGEAEPVIQDVCSDWISPPEVTPSAPGPVVFTPQSHITKTKESWDVCCKTDRREGAGPS